MSYRIMIHRLNVLVGMDTRVTVDDETRPTQLRFYRQDRLTDELVRDAITRAREEFPDEMDPICDVFVDFHDTLGETRRRVAV